jgi:hypothetical protein
MPSAKGRRIVVQPRQARLRGFPDLPMSGPVAPSYWVRKRRLVLSSLGSWSRSAGIVPWMAASLSSFGWGQGAQPGRG